MALGINSRRNKAEPVPAPTISMGSASNCINCEPYSGSVVKITGPVTVSSYMQADFDFYVSRLPESGETFYLNLGGGILQYYGSYAMGGQIRCDITYNGTTYSALSKQRTGGYDTGAQPIEYPDQLVAINSLYGQITIKWTITKAYSNVTSGTSVCDSRLNSITVVTT